MSDTAIAPEPSAGALLRQAREAAGLHVAALAVALKVPVRKLEALEDGRYDQLPDAVFARALASSVCRNLKIDPKPVLARLPQTAAPRLVHDRDGINAPFRAPGDAIAIGWQQQLMRPVPLLVGALLLGAVAILLMPRLRLDQLVATAVQPEPPAVPMAASVVVEPAVAVPAEPQFSAAPASEALSAAIASPTPEPPAATSATAVPAPAPALDSPAATPAPPTSGLIVFKASSPSWVQVVDKRGEVALRRLLAAGESAAASGSPPLSVTVGSVNSTTVEVRGKPFNLEPLAKDNVARFEVK